MLEKDSGYVIVLDKGSPTGIITEKDLVCKVIVLGKNPSEVRVSEITSAPLITIARARGC